MTLHPMIDLLFNPFVGTAGFNMIAFMFWLCVALCVLCVAIERSFKQ